MLTQTLMCFCTIHEQHPGPSEMPFVCCIVFFYVSILPSYSTIPTVFLSVKKGVRCRFITSMSKQYLWCGCASHTWNLRYTFSLHCYYNNIWKYFEIATLKLWSPPEEIYCSPREHRAIFGDIFGCHMGGVGKVQVALNLLPWPGETTPQTKTWPRMSFLQRLKSPALETQVLVVWAAACSLFSQCCNTSQFCQEKTEHPFATRLKVCIPVNVTFF